jgi:hypothetical protein
MIMRFSFFSKATISSFGSGGRNKRSPNVLKRKLLQSTNIKVVGHNLATILFGLVHLGCHGRLPSQSQMLIVNLYAFLDKYDWTLLHFR